MEVYTTNGKRICIEENNLHHLRDISCRRWALLMDDRVTELYAKRLREELLALGLQADCISFPAGETSKNMETYTALCRTLIAKGYGRDDGILAVGGGVTGDLAGFVASTLFRGMHLVQMPTTLLAQTDSCIGGKTGINLPQGKNLIGTFYDADMVLVDPTFLKTLPEDEYENGMAEVIKYGMIADPTILERIVQDTFDMQQLISDCLRIKLTICQQDPLDQNIRHILNFGHTFGHAYEKEAAYEGLKHGQAVAAGMAQILRYQISRGENLQEEFALLENVLKKYHLSSHIPLKNPDSLRIDKKHEGKFIRIAALKKLGEAEVRSVEISELTDGLCNLPG